MQTKPIPGYPGYYADQFGQIYSERSGELRQLAQVMHRGYPHVFVRTGRGNATEKKKLVHSLVLLAYAGPRPPRHVCRHLNGDPCDNRLANLRWGTYAENARDAVRHGTAACLRRGQAHIAAKLRDEDVREIRRLVNAGMRRADAATRFRITARHVGNIITGASWGHVRQG